MPTGILRALHPVDVPEKEKEKRSTSCYMKVDRMKDGTEFCLF